jgi:hypothetical protein
VRSVLVKQLIKNCRGINSQGRSNVVLPAFEWLWWTSLRSWKVTVRIRRSAFGVRRSTMTRKAKSWSGLSRKQKNPGQ